MDLTKFIRDVPDFPKPGILFKDITPLLADPAAYKYCIDEMTAPFEGKKIDCVVGMESRGFIFGSAVAEKLHTGFVPARKPGRLPSKTVKITYDLEYGTDTLEIHEDAFKPGASVLVVDDLLATGGTAKATVDLIKKMGGRIAGLVFVIELSFLGGRDRIDESPIHSLLHFSSE